MKKLLIFAFCVALALSVIWAVLPIAHATDFPTGTANNTDNIVLLGPTVTNFTGSAYFIEGNTTHTLQFVTLCTNAVSNVVSASLNGSNFFTIATNLATTSGTNAISFIGYRFSYIKATAALTTANGSTNTVTYLGGRQ